MATSSIQSARNCACIRQGGCCYYCGLPMLPASTPHAKRLPGLRESAEHLVARKDGGSNAGSNIVGAHITCNQRRHARSRQLLPDAYQALVRSRVEKGRWFHESVLKMLVEIRP